MASASRRRRHSQSPQLREGDGLAAHVLALLGLSADAVRAEVVQSVGDGEAVSPGQLPFAPDARDALRRSADEADALGQEDVASHHLLFGLLRDSDCLAIGILDALGPDAAQVDALARASLAEAPHEARSPQGELENPFSERGMQTVMLAFEEAEGLGQGYVGAEHLLLGLLRESKGTAYEVLASVDITLDRVREQVRGMVAATEATRDDVQSNDEASEVFEHAEREARALGHESLNPEHILVGLTREENSPGTRMLVGLDANPQVIRTRVEAELGRT